MVTLDEIARWKDWVDRRDGRQPQQIRVTPSLYRQLLRLATDRAPLYPWQPNPALFGMTVEVDDTLPRGVWRLCDSYGTLLRDSREGQTLRQITEGR